jgi:hypothetical protein
MMDLQNLWQRNEPNVMLFCKAIAALVFSLILSCGAT